MLTTQSFRIKLDNGDIETSLSWDQVERGLTALEKIADSLLDIANKLPER